MRPAIDRMGATGSRFSARSYDDSMLSSKPVEGEECSLSDADDPKKAGKSSQQSGTAHDA